MSSYKELFQNTAESYSTHRKYISHLLKLIKKEKNYEELFSAMLPFFEAKRDVKNLGNFLQFLTSLFISFNNNDFTEEFQSALIEFLSRGLSAANKVVRYRSSQILSCYVNSIESLR